MKVMLIKPANLHDHIQPSIGLGYLATQIRNIHDVRIVDCLKSRLSDDQMTRIFKEYEPDVIGCTCYSMDLPSVKSILEVVKKYDSNITTIVGGAHPSGAPEHAMGYFSRELCDYVFSGEGEIGFPLFLQALDKSSKIPFGDIPGLGWMNDGNLVVNPKAQVEDLDTLGLPAWDMIKPETYPLSPHGVVCKNHPVVPIMSTRGCPYHCTFCSSAGTKLRKRSPDSILSEVELLYHHHGIREFHMVDDNFTFDMKYAEAIINSLIKLNIDATWATPNGIRLDRVDERLLRMMKRAGFYSISVGIESGSDRIRKKINKGSSVKKIREDLNKLNRVNHMDKVGFFIIGFPGETIDDIEKTIKLALELPIQRATFHTFIPLPGTRLWEELEENGDLDRMDWDNYFFWAGAYVPRGMNYEELKSLHRKAFISFYFRPRIILENLKYVFNFKVLRHGLKYLWRRLKAK